VSPMAAPERAKEQTRAKLRARSKSRARSFAPARDQSSQCRARSDQDDAAEHPTPKHSRQELDEYQHRYARGSWAPTAPLSDFF
jgi:hypothetical protein